MPSSCWNTLKFCQRPEVPGTYKKKIPPLDLRKNLRATAGNLKINEQSKYQSVQERFSFGQFHFFIHRYREKARNMELLNF